MARQSNSGIALDLSQIVFQFEDFIAEAAKESINAGISLGAFIDRFVTEREEFAKANENVAKAMQISTLRAYRERVEALKKYESYRVGQNRMSGGALRRALEDPSMFAFDKDGIQFGNRALLDSTAKHWWRLNFGAGNGGQAGDVRTLTMFGGEIELALDGAPSHAFRMPIGVWRSNAIGIQGPRGGKVRGSFLQRKGANGVRAGSSQGDLFSGFSPTHNVRKGGDVQKPGFYPLSSKKTPGLHSIQARRFFDGALGAAAVTIPLEYEHAVEQLVENAVNKAREFSASLKKAAPK